MNFVVGSDWRDQWDVVITSAGKPSFYTEDNRPFREVDIDTGKVKFKQVTYTGDHFFFVSVIFFSTHGYFSMRPPRLPSSARVKVLNLEKGRVYTAGCLKELTKCINWKHPLSFIQDKNDSPYDDIYSPLTSPTVM